MRLTITRHNLQTAAAQALAATAKRTTLPVLTHALLEATDRGVTFSATDLDHAIRLSVPADVQTPGRVAVPAKTLHDLTRTLGDGPVHLSLAKDRLEVKSGRTTVRLTTLPADDMPAFPAVDMTDAAEIDADALVSLVQRTAFAASTEESRPILNGVLWEAESGKVQLVATNGHRLARASAGTAPTDWPEDGVIVGPTALDLIAKAAKGAGVVRVGRSGNHMGFEVGDATIYTRLIEGPYPRYRQVIPSSHTLEAVIDRAALMAVLSRVRIVASDQSQRVGLEWAPGQVTISTTTPDLGDATETVEAEVRGDPIAIAFNASYLLEILSRVPTDDVRILMSTPERAAIVQPTEGDDALTYLVMPLRWLE